MKIKANPLHKLTTLNPVTKSTRKGHIFFKQNIMKKGFFSQQEPHTLLKTTDPGDQKHTFHHRNPPNHYPKIPML